MCATDKLRMDTHKLIASVYERRPLWDKGDRAYHNRDATKDLWSEVCVELGLDNTAIDVVKKRWNSLRDVFRREFYKASKSATGESIWRYYQSMLFLSPQMRSRGPVLVDVSESHDYAQYEGSMTESPFDSFELDHNLPTLKRRISDDLGDGFDDNTRKVRVEAHNPINESDDSDYHFLMSMIPFMKAVPLHRKMAVRIKLLQVLTEATAQGAEDQQPNNCDAGARIRTLYDGTSPFTQSSSSQ